MQRVRATSLAFALALLGMPLVLPQQASAQPRSTPAQAAECDGIWAAVVSFSDEWRKFEYSLEVRKQHYEAYDKVRQLKAEAEVNRNNYDPKVLGRLLRDKREKLDQHEKLLEKELSDLDAFYEEKIRKADGPPLSHWSCSGQWQKQIPISSKRREACDACQRLLDEQDSYGDALEVLRYVRNNYSRSQALLQPAAEDRSLSDARFGRFSDMVRDLQGLVHSTWDQLQDCRKRHCPRTEAARTPAPAAVSPAPPARSAKTPSGTGAAPTGTGAAPRRSTGTERVQAGPRTPTPPPGFEPRRQAPPPGADPGAFIDLGVGILGIIEGRRGGPRGDRRFDDCQGLRC
jgi:hypothetical protein